MIQNDSTLINNKKENKQENYIENTNNPISEIPNQEINSENTNRNIFKDLIENDTQNEKEQSIKINDITNKENLNYTEIEEENETLNTAKLNILKMMTMNIKRLFKIMKMTNSKSLIQTRMKIQLI